MREPTEMELRVAVRKHMALRAREKHSAQTRNMMGRRGGRASPPDSGEG